MNDVPPLELILRLVMHAACRKTGARNKAARALGMGERTIYGRLKSLGIDDPVGEPLPPEDLERVIAFLASELPQAAAAERLPAEQRRWPDLTPEERRARLEDA